MKGQNVEVKSWEQVYQEGKDQAEDEKGVVQAQVEDQQYAPPHLSTTPSIITSIISRM